MISSIEQNKKYKEDRKKEKSQLSLTAKKQPKPKATKSSKSTKKKLLPRKSIIKKIDKLISQIVRYRDADDSWNIYCISCGTPTPRKESQCCHRIERGRQRYRFDYDNLASGCIWCNFYRKEYHLRIYTVKQVQRLWEKKVQEMLDQSEIDKKTSYKLPTAYLRELLEQITQEHKDLFSKIANEAS